MLHFATPLLINLPYAENSAHWLLRIRDLGGAVWFDSARPFTQRGRFDILCAAPLKVISAHATDDLLASLQAELDRFAPISSDPNIPFHGGGIFLLGYEFGRQLMALTGTKPNADDFPAALAGVYSWAIVVDHQLKRTTLVIRPETPAELSKALQHRLLDGSVGTASTSEPFALTSEWHDDFPAADYHAAFRQLQEYIRAGDCYQVNLARRFHAQYQGDPLTAYLRLRQVAAAPYSAYFEYAGRAVLSFSPERFIAANNRQLLTQPIKGTAPRDRDPARDHAFAQQLINSEKNRAENLMIVDLLRNDFGRSCKPGSIHVEQLFELQSFATVHHLVSSIRGELRDDLHTLDALKSSFPGGSITGAPKLRAMQIIDELEPNARSIFCGSIGYIDANGNMDTNILIRTFLAESETLYAWVGGGIVADSKCDDEFLETKNKIDTLLHALLRPAGETSGTR